MKVLLFKNCNNRYNSNINESLEIFLNDIYFGPGTILSLILNNKKNLSILKEVIKELNDNNYYMSDWGENTLYEYANHWQLKGWISDYWVLEGDWNSLLKQMREVALLDEIIC